MVHQNRVEKQLPLVEASLGVSSIHPGDREANSLSAALLYLVVQQQRCHAGWMKSCFLFLTQTPAIQLEMKHNGVLEVLRLEAPGFCYQQNKKQHKQLSSFLGAVKCLNAYGAVSGQPLLPLL